MPPATAGARLDCVRDVAVHNLQGVERLPADLALPHINVNDEQPGNFAGYDTYAVTLELSGKPGFELIWAGGSLRVGYPGLERRMLSLGNTRGSLFAGAGGNAVA